MKPSRRLARHLAPLANILLCAVPLVVFATSEVGTAPVLAPESPEPLSTRLDERPLARAELADA